MEKLKTLLASRKFWALVIAILTAASGYYTGAIQIWVVQDMIVKALMVYIGAVAVEDGLSKRQGETPADPRVDALRDLG